MNYHRLGPLSACLEHLMNYNRLRHFYHHLSYPVHHSMPRGDPDHQSLKPMM